MLNYSNLNDIEFEYLCQDIMQKKLDVNLRRFSAGRDGGIDLKPASGGVSVIIQVKHYRNASISSLMSTLRGEVEKVKKLKPKQYYLCCSCTLSPLKITEIYGLFSPYMRSEENIVALETATNKSCKKQKLCYYLVNRECGWITRTQPLFLCISNRSVC